MCHTTAMPYMHVPAHTALCFIYTNRNVSHYCNALHACSSSHSTVFYLYQQKCVTLLQCPTRMFQLTQHCVLFIPTEMCHTTAMPYMHVPAHTALFYLYQQKCVTLVQCLTCMFQLIHHCILVIPAELPANYYRIIFNPLLMQHEILALK